jgi:hypothetical protein
MSKAFTKEDDGGGTNLPPRVALPVAAGPFHVTPQGLLLMGQSADERVRALVPSAQRIELPPGDLPHAILGATVLVRDQDDQERSYVLVGSEERALTNQGCSVLSPLGRALLGAVVGEVREIVTPKGTSELTVVRITG